MDYCSEIMVYSPIFYISNSLMAYIAYLLAGRRMPYRKVFTLQIPAALIQSAAYSAWMFIDDSPNVAIHYLLMSLFRLSEIVIMISWIYFLFRDTDRKKRFFYMSTVFSFNILADFGSTALIGVMSPEIQGASALNLYDTAFRVLVPYLLVNVGVAAIIRIASKTKFWNKLQAFGEYPKLHIPMGMVYFLFYAVFGAFSKEHSSYYWHILCITLPYLALLGLVVYIVSDLKRAENLSEARNLLLQQQNYINKLESVQQEIRSIQHDYKNMLSGLYAQASEGNVKAVKEYIDAKLLKVDESVREDLRRMNQLTRIEIPELKGLIMTKILDAERDKVSFRLEVMFPVVRASMATEDLLRCVGILLDNAVEEARAQKDAVVTLLLLQENTALTIVVRNPVRVKPDLVRIRNAGYSTKGPGRGVGLSNYQNIIRKYPNTTQETKIEEGYFVQVLVLAGNQ